jgi:hypothetical protein
LTSPSKALRQKWQLEIEAFDLTTSELESASGDRAARWRPGEIVLEFDAE